MYRYFVSYYVATGNKSGFGHVETNTDTEITGIEGIRNVAESIERDNNFPSQSVIIINYKLFGKEE